jgi:hypothetical protein
MRSVKRNEGKLESNFPSHEQASLQFCRRKPGYWLGPCSDHDDVTVELIARQQPVLSIGERAQRNLLESLILGQGWSLVGFLDRGVLIHDDTSVLGWLRLERY